MSESNIHAGLISWPISSLDVAKVGFNSYLYAASDMIVTSDHDSDDLHYKSNIFIWCKRPKSGLDLNVNKRPSKHLSSTYRWEVNHTCEACEGSVPHAVRDHRSSRTVARSLAL